MSLARLAGMAEARASHAEEEELATLDRGDLPHKGVVRAAGKLPRGNQCKLLHAHKDVALLHHTN